MPAYDYGSEHQLRRWVLEYPAELNGRLLRGSDTLREFAREIEWLRPAADSTSELRDAAWRAVGLLGPSPVESGWWPARGPRWDAVARVVGLEDQVGALLVEAKGRKSELRGRGTRALGARFMRIRDALADVQAALGVPIGTNWTRAVYQPANRIATLWFARERSKPPLPVWLVSLYFLGEEYPTVTGPKRGPATEDEWRALIQNLHDEMGLPPHPTVLSPWWIELFLEPLGPSADEVAPPRAAR